MSKKTNTKRPKERPRMDASSTVPSPFSDTVLVWMKALVLASLSVFLPIKPLMLATLFLVLADTVTGVWAAKKLGQVITSAKLRRCVSKSLVYTLALLVTHVAGTYLLDTDFTAKVMAGALGLVELKSVLENMNKITGGDIFAGVLAKLGSKNDKEGP